MNGGLVYLLVVSLAVFGSTRFQVITAVVSQVPLYWNVTLCSLVCANFSAFSQLKIYANSGLINFPKTGKKKT
jgi:hypothetical protein